MRFSTRFLLLLGFLFVGVLLAIWFGVRPNYEQAVLDERTTIVSEHQRERIELAQQRIDLWVASVLQMQQHVSGTLSFDSGTFNFDQPRAMFSGFSGLIPELRAFRLVEEITGEYVEFRAHPNYNMSDYHLLEFRPVYQEWMGTASNQDSTDYTSISSQPLNTIYSAWLHTDKRFIIAGRFKLQDEPYRIVAEFDASTLEDILFSHQFGVPLHSVLWLDGQTGISDSVLPNYQPRYEPVTRVEWTIIGGDPTVVISTPMPALRANYSMYFDPNAIQGPIRRLLTQSLWILAFVFFALGGATFLLFTQLARPVRQFIEDVQPFASFDFSKPFSPINVPELHEVSIKMEEIRSKLAHYQRINVEQIISNQERINLMMEHATDAIAVFDKDGIFTFRNTPFVELFLDHNEPAPGSLLKFESIDFVNKVKIHNEVEYYPHPLKVRVIHKEISLSTKPEQFCYYDLQQIELFNDTGERIGGQLILYDLTNERQIDRLRNDMINIIVHELKNPIAAIKGYAGILLYSENMNEQDRSEIYKLINGSTDALLDVVERFMKVSSLESGSTADVMLPVNLSTLITDITRDMTPVLFEKNLKFDVRITADLHPVFVSKELMGDMLRNLLSNAIKYGPASRTIIVELGLQGKKYFISVTDHGYGIPPEHRDKVFRKFYRISEQSKEKGSGLGLTYVREIVKKHNGTIELESDKEIGSRFTVRIPYFPYEGSMEEYYEDKFQEENKG